MGSHSARGVRTAAAAARLLVGSALGVAAGLGLLLVVFVGWTGMDWTSAGAAVLALRGSALACLALLVALLAFEWRLVRALARARRPAAADPRDGAAVIEFALLFPFAVMVLLIIVQLALLMQGNLIVNYAAYAATRTAVVQIPRDLSAFGEDRNNLNLSPNGAKMRRIRRAMVLALTPVSGRVAPSAEALDIQAGFRDLYANAGLTPRPGLNQAFAEKFTYADERSEVARVEEYDGTAWWYPPGFGQAFGGRRPVRVTIRHDLELPVPFARAIFADGSFVDSGGRTHYFTTVEAHYTLTNEGPLTEPPWPYCPSGGGGGGGGSLEPPPGYPPHPPGFPTQ